MLKVYWTTFYLLGNTPHRHATLVSVYVLRVALFVVWIKWVGLNEALSHYSSRMRLMSHKRSATKQRLHPQSAAETSHHSVKSNPVPWQNWMAAYLGYTLRIKTLFRGWPIMVLDTHTRRRMKRKNFRYSRNFFLTLRSAFNRFLLH